MLPFWMEELACTSLFFEINTPMWNDAQNKPNQINWYPAQDDKGDEAG